MCACVDESAETLTNTQPFHSFDVAQHIPQISENKMNRSHKICTPNIEIAEIIKMEQAKKREEKQKVITRNQRRHDRRKNPFPELKCSLL